MYVYMPVHVCLFVYVHVQCELCVCVCVCMYSYLCTSVCECACVTSMCLGDILMLRSLLFVINIHNETLGAVYSMILSTSIW